MREKMVALRSPSARVGLKINTRKTREMRIQVREGNPLHIGSEDIQRVDNFTYLGSMVSVTGGTEEDIIAPIRKAQQAFACLRAVWKATSLSLKTKIRIFNSNVKSVLLYGSESWRLTNTLLPKVQTFVNKRLHQILSIFWPNVIILDMMS